MISKQGHSTVLNLNGHESIRHLGVCSPIQNTAHPQRSRAHLEARLRQHPDRRAQCRAQLFRRARSPSHPPAGDIHTLILIRYFTKNTDIAVPGKISRPTPASVRVGCRICRDRSCCTPREPIQAWRPCVWGRAGCLWGANRCEA